ncbi:hypothetical protein NUSPORA_01030 [Nucleospora cyclopteri]
MPQDDFKAIFPSSSEQLYEFLRDLDEPFEVKEKTYSHALESLKDDLFSLYIFFDYIDMLMVQEDYIVIEKIYTCYRTKFKRYHLFWKKSLEFSVFYLKKDFSLVYEKIILYLKNSDSANRNDILEYLEENKEKLKKSLSENKKLFINRHFGYRNSDLSTPGSEKKIVGGEEGIKKMQIDFIEEEENLSLEKQIDKELFTEIKKQKNSSEVVLSNSDSIYNSITDSNFYCTENKSDEINGNTCVNSKSNFEFPVLENTQPLNVSTPDYIIVKNKKFTILERIGKGGFSAVHKVLHNNKIYALKKASKGDFDKEISILKKLNTPKGDEFIIKMIDCQVDMLSNTVILLLEYGEIDLQSFINKYSYSNLFIKYSVEAILKIVDFLHSNQIIHKDIKPANFVFVKGRIKIIDFGISAEIGPDTTSCLNNKEGTAYYSSPEVFQMQKVSRSTDMWSVGCILHYLIYKETVFTQEQVLNMKEIINSKKPIEYKKFDRDKNPVDKLAIDLMKCCLCYDPNERKKASDLLQYHPYFKS